MFLSCVAAVVPAPQGWRSPVYAPSRSGRLGKHAAMPAFADAASQPAPLLLQAWPVEGADVHLTDVVAPQLPRGAGLQLPGGQALTLPRAGVAALPAVDQQPQQSASWLATPAESVQLQDAAQMLQQLLASPAGQRLLQQALGRPGSREQSPLAPTSASASQYVPAKTSQHLT